MIMTYAVRKGEYISDGENSSDTVVIETITKGSAVMHEAGIKRTF